METEPDAFTSGATKDQRIRLIKLVAGSGSTGFKSLSIQMSLFGTQLGAVTNTFLLGLSEHPDSVGPIIDILNYDSQPIIDRLTNATGLPKGFYDKRLLFANRAVATDSLDRILVACAENENINQEALSLAKQYIQWRESQDVPDREVQMICTYDSSTTPYHLPGKITGVKEAKTFELRIFPFPSLIQFINGNQVVAQYVRLSVNLSCFENSTLYNST